MNDLLFVYGTLRPGLPPDEIASVAEKLRPVTEASVTGDLYDLGQFPGAVLCSNPEHRIHGILFELPREESVLRDLDLYEEFSPDRPEACQFRRVRCKALTSAGGTVDCWIYVYARDLQGAPHIEDGYWRGPSRAMP